MKRNREWLRRLPASWYGWTGLMFLLMGLMTLIGGVLGFMVYPVAGSLLRMDLTVAEMAAHGFYDGAFLTFIWAPGASFIAVVIAAYEKRRTFPPQGG